MVQHPVSFITFFLLIAFTQNLIWAKKLSISKNFYQISTYFFIYFFCSHVHIQIGTLTLTPMYMQVYILIRTSAGKSYFYTSLKTFGLFPEIFSLICIEQIKLKLGKKNQNYFTDGFITIIISRCIKIFNKIKVLLWKAKIEIYLYVRPRKDLTWDSLPRKLIPMYFIPLYQQMHFLMERPFSNRI